MINGKSLVTDKHGTPPALETCAVNKCSSLVLKKDPGATDTQSTREKQAQFFPHLGNFQALARKLPECGVWVGSESFHTRGKLYQRRNDRRKTNLAVSASPAVCADMELGILLKPSLAAAAVALWAGHVLLHLFRHLPGLGHNGKGAFAKVSGSGPGLGMFVAMGTNIKFPVHRCHLSRTWESNGQVRVLISLVTETFMNSQHKWRNHCSGMP